MSLTVENCNSILPTDNFLKPSFSIQLGSISKLLFIWKDGMKPNCSNFQTKVLIFLSMTIKKEVLDFTAIV